MDVMPACHTSCCFGQFANASCPICCAVLCCALQSDPAFLSALESGLKDHQDVKAPTHLMLAKLASSPGMHTHTF